MPPAAEPAQRAGASDGTRSANATPNTSTVETALRTTLATTWPAEHRGAADVHRPEPVHDAVVSCPG